MSRKQEIYQQMLEMALPNVCTILSELQGHSMVAAAARMRKGDRIDAGLELMQLVYSVTPTLFEEAFTEHDLWVLNTHARVFINSPNARKSELYPVMARHIKELFTLIPDEMREEMGWSGPSDEEMKDVIPEKTW